LAKASRSGIRLTRDDAAIVKGMLARGDRQHDIASWFGVNGGRIAEISTGDNFASVTMERDNLPPSGPYLSGKLSNYVRSGLFDLRTGLLDLRSEMEGGKVEHKLAKLIDDLDELLTKLNY
jgi:hypothetical protein